MESWINEFVSSYGYFGVAFLIAVENLFPPIPSEVILTLGGFLTTSAELNIYLIILASTIGSVVGAVILYYVGKIMKTERLEKLIDSRLGRILRLKHGDFQKASAWFERRGKSAVFLCRFVPIVRSLISIPAGVTEMHLAPFVLLTTLGSLIWNTVLIFLGRFFGEAYLQVAHMIDAYALIVAGIIIVCFAAGVFYYFKKRKKR